MKTRINKKKIDFPKYNYTGISPAIRTLILISFLFCVLFYGCGASQSYEDWMRQESQSGIRQDSLFLGFHFGMNKDTFFNRCRQYNKEGVLKDSGKHLRIVYNSERDFSRPVQWYFYPKFKNGVIWKMNMQCAYQSWTPWNKEVESSQLLPELLPYFEKTYGGKFRKFENTAQQPFYVLVQGNRRIKVWIKDMQFVEVEFVNLPDDEAEKK